MTPIVFWASLLPWLKAMKAADSTCRRRNVSFIVLGWTRRKMLKITTMSSSAAMKPTIGDPTRGRSTLPPMPERFHEPTPAATAADPSRPPMSAWLDELGIPSRQVMRFQVMAPTRAAAITVWLSACVVIRPPPIVFATAVPTKAPPKFAMALMTIAHCGFSARVDTEVAMALAVSWKPLM